MERTLLSDEDRRILDLEGPTIVGHTCKVAILAAPAPSLRALRESIASRLGAAPELRSRLDDSGAEPAWVEDGDFAIEDHVVEGGEGAGERALRERVAALFALHLDRARPLWRIDVLRRPDGGAALIWRLHHALADGVTAMRLASATLWDQEPAGGRPRSRSASGAGARADDRRRRGHLAAFVERELAPATAASPFDGEIGRHRSVAFAETSLGRLHDAAAALAGATLNDAVLSVVTGALHRWLSRRHEDLASLRIRVPVSLHHEGDSASNRDSFFTVSAPVCERDPLERLVRIAAATAERKSADDAERIDTLTSSDSAVGRWTGGFIERLEASPRSFALAVSNVRGPGRPVTICGVPVLGLYSLAEVGRRHGLRVTAVSCADRLGLGFCADPGIVPDVERLAAAVEPEAEALISAAG